MMAAVAAVEPGNAMAPIAVVAVEEVAEDPSTRAGQEDYDPYYV